LNENSPEVRGLFLDGSGDSPEVGGLLLNDSGGSPERLTLAQGVSESGNDLGTG